MLQTVKRERDDLFFMQAYRLQPHSTRFAKILKKDDPQIPPALFSAERQSPDLVDFPYPLPSKKTDYTCYANGQNGVFWLGAKTGLTRYDPHAEREADVVQFFAAARDLADNCIITLLADGDNVWVQTETAVSFIKMQVLRMEEKANLLLAESVKYVDRRGMMSQKGLTIPRDLDSILPYGESDNDGCFTSGYAIAEMLHYAVLREKLGIDHPETQRIRAIAMRSVEATLLLFYVHRRGDGFIARTYLTKDEPVPNGQFYRITNNKATPVENQRAKDKGLVGLEIDASAPIPPRLAKLYEQAGYTVDDLIYKGDTSSDEVTLHYMHLYFIHEIFGKEDAELDALAKDAAKGNLAHIIAHGYEMHECDGKATTWAKWSPEYFNTGVGWADACLNAAEVLFYHKVVMHITGESGRWQQSYEKLLEMGYADLTEKHFDRFNQMALMGSMEPCEDLMYGDNMLATIAFWGLCTLEKDEALLAKYRRGYKSWDHTLRREHNPGYDYPFLLSCPDETVDTERLADWFYRFHPSRLAAGVSTSIRKDIPQRTCRGGYQEISTVLPPDECFIAKYDRNPLQLRDEDSGGVNTVESCYVFTFAYWIGRYYGFLEE